MLLFALLLAAVPVEAQRACSMLRYVAEDYPSAMGPDAVAQQELSEQQGFAAQAGADLRALGDRGLAARVDELLARIGARRPPAEVVPLASALADSVAQRFQVELLPRRRPDLRRGARLYRTACAACHGADGTPQVEHLQLSTAPTAFASRDQVARLSPQRVFAAVTFGVPGTAMPSFGDALDESARWDLAYAALLFAHPDAERRRGEELLRSFPRRPDWLQLATRSDDHLRAVLARSPLSPADREAVLSALRGAFADPPQAEARLR